VAPEQLLHAFADQADDQIDDALFVKVAVLTAVPVRPVGAVSVAIEPRSAVVALAVPVVVVGRAFLVPTSTASPVFAPMVATGAA
jgi:hypothetical protein